jgi:PAS domain S-box-containing protein
MEKLPVDNPNPLLNVDCQALLDENRALKDENQALQDEVQKLRARLEEPEELKRTISEGDLDALVMPVSNEDLPVFTLADADSTFHTMAEIANEDIVVVDANFKITYVGKRLLDKTGYSQEEVIGRPWMHFVDREYKTFVKKKIKERRDGSNDSYEVKFIRRDSSPHWVLVSSKPLFDNDGKFKGAFAMLTDITERKQAEISLKKSESSLAQAQRIAHIGSWEWNIQTGDVHWSDELYFIYGVDKHTFIPTINSFADYIHPDDREFVYRIMNQIMSGEKSVNFDFRIISVDGSMHILNTIAEVIDFDENGKPRLLKGINQDITERKKVEEALRESEQRLQAILDGSDNAFYVKDLEGRFILINKHLEELLGMKRDGVYGKTDYDFFTPELADCYKVNDSRILASGVPEQLEEVADLVDGHHIFLANKFPLYDLHGKPYAICGISADITERKRIDEALKESEEKYRNIVETANEGIWVLDAKIKITYANTKMAEMLGYSPEEMIGKQGVYFVDNEYKKYTELRTEKRKQGIDEVHENKLVRKDGSTLWVLVNSKSLFDKAGKFTGILAMLTDITELKNAQEERERLLDHIQQEKDRLSALVNSITDEIWFADTQKNFALVNPSGLSEFGISTEEYIGVENLAKNLEVYRPDGSSRPIEEAPNLLALQGEVVKNQEEIIRTPVHGELRYRQVSASPVRDTNGNIIGSVAVVRDITELKEAEKALREAHDSLEERVKERTVELEKAYKSLKESENGLAEAQKIAHIGNWDWNIVTNALHWSDEIYRIFGCNPQEFGATYNAFLSYIHPDDREYVNNAVIEALNGKSYSIDHRVILADGEECIVH